MATTKEILQKAREIISEPGSWCQGAYARDADGEPVCHDSSTAVSFCMLGAIRKAREPEDVSLGDISTVIDCLQKQNPEISSNFVDTFNDNEHFTQEKALAAFDCAIA